jgi:hypothetical protein
MKLPATRDNQYQVKEKQSIWNKWIGKPGYTQGHYAKYNGGLNLNHRNKKINLFGNYNYNNGDYLMKMQLDKVQFDTCSHNKTGLCLKIIHTASKLV